MIILYPYIYRYSVPKNIKNISIKKKPRPKYHETNPSPSLKNRVFTASEKNVVAAYAQNLEVASDQDKIDAFPLETIGLKHATTPDTKRHIQE